jgi:hypothetical protein
MQPIQANWASNCSRLAAACARKLRCAAVLVTGTVPPTLLARADEVIE